MPVDPESGLITHPEGTGGWDVSNNANIDILKAKLKHVLKDNLKILGEETVSNPSTITAGDPSETAVAPIIGTVSGSGDDATINAALASLETQVNGLITDRSATNAELAKVLTDLTSVRDQLVDLLTKLRKDTGNGTLKAL